MPYVTVQHSEPGADALNLHCNGFDIADALALASSPARTSMATLDDRGFSLGAKRMSLTPEVVQAVQRPSRRSQFAVSNTRLARRAAFVCTEFLG